MLKDINKLIKLVDTKGSRFIRKHPIRLHRVFTNSNCHRKRRNMKQKHIECGENFNANFFSCHIIKVNLYS